MRSLVLIISLLFAFAGLQGQGAMFLRGSQPAPTPGAGILDSYLGAAFAAAPDVLIYSAHSVTDNTVGSQTEGQTGQFTVLVRRDNDDALRSFTYTEVNDGTLAAWVGPANNGFVQILYDQSTNGNHATQSTAANQPKIVDNGSLVVENGKAALEFSKHRLINSSVNFGQPNTFFQVFKRASTSGFNADVLIDSYSDNNQNAIYNTGLEESPIQNWAMAAGIGVRGGAFNPAGLSLLTVLFSGSASSLFGNGNLLQSGNAGTGSLDGMSIGDIRGNPNPVVGGYSLNGKISCSIIYNSNQSTNRTAIETAINTAYSIY